LLIESAVSRTDNYLKSAKDIDQKMYGGVGAGLAIALAFFLAPSAGALTVAAIVGGLLGRIVVWQKYR
jgi:hypothetical protein